jgi:deoxyadenosine/deoxycytidine kinase
MDLRYHYIAIEGNIGAGKTTLAKKLSSDLHAELLLEKFEDNPFLPKFYEHPERYAFSVELFFTAERYRQLKNFLIQKQFTLFHSVTVSDFIFQKSLVFAGINLSDDEWTLFRVLFDIMLPTLPQPDIIFYLFTPTNTLLENIQKRGREYEKYIRAEYLDKIHHAYVNYFKQMHELTVVFVNTQQYNFIENQHHYHYFLQLLQSDFNKGITVLE